MYDYLYSHNCFLYIYKKLYQIIYLVLIYFYNGLINLDNLKINLNDIK